MRDQAMKRYFAAGILAAALCLGPRAMAAPPDEVGSIDPSGDHDPADDRVQLPPDPEGKAVEFRLAGKCDEAIPILRRLSGEDDIANYNLGLCLIQTGKAANNTPLQQEGAQWIMKAANHGLPNAQSSLVAVFLDGSGVAKDPIEAGKWALVYQENGTRMALGLPDIPHDVQARLDSTLNDQTWMQAQDRASSWAPTSQRRED
jgi:hypothetical protein